MSGPQERLNSRQWRVIAIFALGAMFEFFDNYVIAFVLAFIVKPWALSVGESATVLLSSGLGGLAGSLIWGAVADRYGRKLAFVASLLVTATASLLLAFTPEGNWVYLASVRALVGLGVGGFFVPIILVQEIVPASRKGFASGFLSTAAASGLVLGALSAATMTDVLGWRGLFLLGTLPGFLAIIALKALPESPSWLGGKGRVDEATKALRWTSGDPEIVWTAPAASGAAKAKSDTAALIAGIVTNFGTVTAYTALVMWSPTLIVQVQGIAPGEAAKLMIIIAAIGMTSRLCIGAISDRVGRRRAGISVCIGAALSVMLASFVARGVIVGQEHFWMALGLAFVFADASFAVLAAYTAEIFPAAARGRSSGISYAAGGVGKVVGPLGFGLAIGASNVLKPEMTITAVFAGFGFIAILFVIAAGAYAFIRPGLTRR
ncbi:MFS transporter [Sphingobium boeckii]|uniref:Putative MFS transporter n=1 Tax=Sphingobium boeckii TaxID=1082345 RepID=A0A7W9ALK8_9SPHN|nr:MFS transporter [Sphingobium boeckii]MBB5687746.1 putative MFS transporter [Sphingobium boeckii]